MSVIGPVQSRCYEGSPEKVESWYQKTTLCLKKAPTLTSCSIGKNRLILTILGKQHQQTFKNDMHIQLSLFLHFIYFITLFAFKHSDGNDAKQCVFLGRLSTKEPI